MFFDVTAMRTVIYCHIKDSQSYYLNLLINIPKHCYLTVTAIGVFIKPR